MKSSDDDISGLLRDWHDGSNGALDRLVPLVERDLRRIAQQRLSVAHPDNTVTATSLVQELFIRLTASAPRNWQGRAHFFALCAAIMRNVLVDHARASLSGKRGGGMKRVPFEGAVEVDPNHMEEVLMAHEAVIKLAEVDERKARVVEMRFFGGMSVEETAEALGISPETVTRDWRIARMWLMRHMGGKDDDIRTRFAK